MADTDEDDKKLQKINTIIPYLNGNDPKVVIPASFGPDILGYKKRYGPTVMRKQRYLMLLYFAKLTEFFRSFGHNIDGRFFFSVRDLERIAISHGLTHKVKYDRSHALRHFLDYPKEQVIHIVKEVPQKKDKSKTIRTDLFALTEKGEQSCENIMYNLIPDTGNERFNRKLSNNLVEKCDEPKSELYQSFGLDWLTNDYFDFHKTTEKDFDNWKKGFEFDLPSIKAGRELRRETLIADIKSKLENDGKLLIVGPSGSSKSTILMELMCDYFDAGYEILYNNGVTDIKNAYGLLNFIENRLRNGKKILVAIDDAHHERTNSIFYVIDKLSNSQVTKNLRFIIAARLPEFDWQLESLDKVQEDVRKSIRKLIGDPKFIYYLPYFTREEIKDFMILYLETIDDYVIDNKSQEIYNYTKGDPIMVKFSVFGQGLEQDVEEMYDRYLRTQLEMKTMLICSLLDTSNIEITDKILELCGVLEGAYHLNGATLYRNAEGSWRTKHPRWDRELFSFLYSKNSMRTRVERRKQDLNDSLIAIYRMKEEDITYSVVLMLYYIASQNFVSIDIIESIFQQSISQMPTFLSNERKSSLYSSPIAEAYYVLKRYQEALDKSNEALKLNSRDATVHNSKGLALTELRRFDEAVECFAKALEINPNFASAWMHKGNALDYSGNYKEAIECYDKALEIDPDYLPLLLWINQGACFHHLGKYKEAIECYDKALKIVHYEKPLHTRILDLSIREDYLLYMNSIEAHTWSLKGDSLYKLGKYDDVIESYHESLNLNANNTETWLRKGMLHAALMDEHKVAVECYDQALKIDPNFAEAWYYKGLTLLHVGGSDAQNCMDKAKELGFKI
jgi:tetratricopeptide (TPR) repeat protein